MFNLIVALEKNTLAIGLKNGLPWRCKKDLELFQEITTKNTLDKFNILIVGYKTFVHLPKSFKPKNRRFVIVKDPNRRFEYPEHLKQYILFSTDTFDKAYYKTSIYIPHDTIYVIGGASIYKKALTHTHLNNIYAGVFDIKDVKYDTCFPISLNSMKIQNVIYENNECEISIDNVKTICNYKLLKLHIDNKKNLLCTINE